MCGFCVPWNDSIQAISLMNSSVNSQASSIVVIVTRIADITGLPVDGQWSSWADWSQCSGNCEWGRQSRYRYCNSPTPSNGGRFCEGGRAVEWRECQSDCNPGKSVVFVRLTNLDRRTLRNRSKHRVKLKTWLIFIQITYRIKY